MRRVFLFCFVVLTIAQMEGQTIHQMRMQLDTTIEPMAQAKGLLKLANLYRFKNLDSTMHFTISAERVCLENGMDSMLVRAYDYHAKVYSLKSNFEKQVEYIKKAGEHARQNNFDFYHLQWLNMLGKSFDNLGVFDSSLYYTTLYDEGLKSRGMNRERWNSQLDLADLYYDIGDQDQAEIHIEKACEFARIEKKPFNYLYVLSRAILIYEGWGLMDRASELTEEYLTFKVNRENNLDRVLDIPAHTYMAGPANDPVKQEKKLLENIVLHQTSGSWVTLSMSYHKLGRINMERNQPQKAIEFLKAGLVAADSTGFQNIQFNVHKALYQAYEQAGQADLALEHLKQSFDLRESIRDMQRQNQVKQLEVKFETAKKDEELAVNALALAESKRKQQFLTYGILGLLLFAGLILYTLYSKQKANQLLAQKNQIISDALEEKDILLREIHHRVKNNLQMISALLYLQGKSIDDPTARDAIKESENRVQSMAMIHQKLYRDENLLGVDVNDYLDRLFSHLFASYNIEGARIRLEKDIEVQNMDVDKVIPLALIVNELVSNALKYAFKDGREGVITVSLKQVGQSIELKVEDNGAGLPEGFNQKTSGNFGYKLINILSEKLNADWTVGYDDGTKVKLDVPVAA